jgi:hypothetical protein
MTRCSDTSRIEEYEMPCLEAMLASALALMTAYAQHPCAHGRQLMAGRVVLCLAHLRADARLSASARLLLTRLAVEWEDVQGDAKTIARTRH